ncbi:N-acetylmuramoyl-L-alanine amidase family protein [Halpernia frigidisoli]|uniref:N-acetylmuramoyl-L-alanine amidase n=1 Tax=Halpernia frigidisoli TaxID=1125876 RepID=A0A1I3GJ50_9FLAO|nr:N-acetylmuramoyl-L-alanine amidase [Halpernia frigidisoli]SFI23520.1 N-acetylmuramoyl-L-alanine amidase [Halpernia frigidisoli]
MINPRFNIIKCFFLISLLFSSFTLAQKKFVLVLDAGHGGSDFGANRSYSDVGKVNEKDVTLQITLKLGKLLEKNKDIKVIFTRTVDEYPSLTSRTNLANRSKADLFISIHCNASGPTPYGTETFVQGPDQNRTNLEVAKEENDVSFLNAEDRQTFSRYNPSAPESIIALKIQQSKYLEASLAIGSFVEDNFANKNKRLSRGVKQKDLHVLRLNAMPSILVETGFISNNDEAHYLISDEGQNEIARSVYDAIISYKNLKGNVMAVTAPVEPPKPVEIPSKNDFRIMLMSTPIKYNEDDPALKGLKYILTLKENGLYKYYYSTTNMTSIRDNNIKTAKDAGFRNAFSVGFIPNQTLGSGYYRIELLVSKDKLNSNSYILTALKDVDRNKDKGLFYYTYGKFRSLEQAVEVQNDLEKKGIKNTVIEKVLNN